jgi:hypothetical protein
MPARASDTVHRKRSGISGVFVNRAPSAATIDRLRAFQGRGLPTVTAYVAVAPGPEGRAMARSETDSLLHRIRPLVEDRSLEHDARMSLREDIERIEELFDAGARSAGTLAIFSCSGGGLLEVIVLPRTVRDRIMVDATPWVRPLLSVLDGYLRCCVVSVDRNSARVWELYLGEVTETELPGARLRGVGYANERREAHRADQLEGRHFKRVAAALDELFHSARYDALALAGHQDELPRFVQFLAPGLQERLAGSFALDHKHLTPAMIRKHGEAVLERYQLDCHRRAVDELLGAEASGGAAATGLERCLWAGSLAAVQTLYVDEGAVMPGVVCDRSRWFALSAETCPICGERMRRTADVIDELVEAVIDDGGSINHLRGESELRERLVAARLHFPLPASEALSSGSGD